MYQPVFVKENSFDVLKKLSENFRIIQYNTLEIPNFSVDSSNFKINSLNTARILFYGFSIDNNVQQDLSSTLSVDDYNLTYPHSTIDNKTLVESLIRSYLITSEVVKEGHTIFGPGQRVKSSEPDTLKIITYFDLPKKSRKKLDAFIPQILEYSQGVLGNDFTMDSLEKLTKEIKKTVPTKRESYNETFATLRCSTPGSKRLLF